MYNYLNDAMKINFTNAMEYRICEKSKCNCQIKATICGECYQDPDAVSKKLYVDIRNIFSQKDLFCFSVVGNRKQWYLKFDDLYEHQLSTDYIGPSRNLALKYLNGNSENKAKIIGNFLLTSRTIGGHVFWPAHQINKQNTINQVKGKSGIFDRIDITLAEIENFYKSRYAGEALYSKPLYEALQRYQWFFEIFHTFPNFVKKMKLDDFLDNNKVISLLESDLENKIVKSLSQNSNFEPSNYVLYISNCCILIKKRTKRINQEE